MAQVTRQRAPTFASLYGGPRRSSSASAFCRITGKSRSMDEHHYVFSSDDFPKFDHKCGCRITEKNDPFKDYKYVYPVLDLDGVTRMVTEHDFHCRVTAKYRAMAGHKYVYPVLGAVTHKTPDDMVSVVDEESMRDVFLPAEVELIIRGGVRDILKETDGAHLFIQSHEGSLFPAATKEIFKRKESTAPNRQRRHTLPVSLEAGISQELAGIRAPSTIIKWLKDVKTLPPPKKEVETKTFEMIPEDVEILKDVRKSRPKRPGRRKTNKENEVPNRKKTKQEGVEPNRESETEEPKPEVPQRLSRLERYKLQFRSFDEKHNNNKNSGNRLTLVGAFDADEVEELDFSEPAEIQYIESKVSMERHAILSDDVTAAEQHSAQCNGFAEEYPKFNGHLADENLEENPKPKTFQELKSFIGSKLDLGKALKFHSGKQLHFEEKETSCSGAESAVVDLTSTSIDGRNGEKFASENESKKKSAEDSLTVHECRSACGIGSARQEDAMERSNGLSDETMPLDDTNERPLGDFDRDFIPESFLEMSVDRQTPVQKLKNEAKFLSRKSIENFDAVEEVSKIESDATGMTISGTKRKNDDEHRLRNKLHSTGREVFAGESNATADNPSVIAERFGWLSTEVEEKKLAHRVIDSDGFTPDGVRGGVENWIRDREKTEVGTAADPSVCKGVDPGSVLSPDSTLCRFESPLETVSSQIQPPSVCDFGLRANDPFPEEVANGALGGSSAGRDETCTLRLLERHFLTEKKSVLESNLASVADLEIRLPVTCGLLRREICSPPPPDGTRASGSSSPSLLRAGETKEEPAKWNSSTCLQGVDVYVAIMDFRPMESDEEAVAMKEGQQVEVIDASKPRRWLVRVVPMSGEGEETAKEGWVPACYLEKSTAYETLGHYVVKEAELDPKELEAVQNREAIVKELVETEEDFAKDMHFVVENYYKQMDNPRLPKEFRDRKGSVFGNFKDISDFHNNVLMEGIHYHSKEPTKLGKTFLRLERDFDMHANYCWNEARAQQLLREGPLKEYFDDHSRMIDDDKMLADHLKLPIQRLNDYQLLLKELIKYSARLKEDVADLQKALDFIHSINKRTRDLQYIQAMQGCEGDLLKIGKIVRHEVFDVVEEEVSADDACERYVFLFKGRVFVTERRTASGKESYHVTNLFKLQDVEVSESVEGDPTGISFRSHKKNRPGFPLTLRARSLEQKTNWCRDIASANQAVEDLGDLEPSIERPSELKHAEQHSELKHRAEELEEPEFKKPRVESVTRQDSVKKSKPVSAPQSPTGDEDKTSLARQESVKKKSKSGDSADNDKPPKLSRQESVKKKSKYSESSASQTPVEESTAPVLERQNSEKQKPSAPQTPIDESRPPLLEQEDSPKDQEANEAIFPKVSRQDSKDAKPEGKIKRQDSTPEEKVKRQDSTPEEKVKRQDSTPEEKVKRQDSKPEEKVKRQDSTPEEKVKRQDSTPEEKVKRQDSKPDEKVKRQDSKPEEKVKRQDSKDSKPEEKVKRQDSKPEEKVKRQDSKPEEKVKRQDSKDSKPEEKVKRQDSRPEKTKGEDLSIPKIVMSEDASGSDARLESVDFNEDNATLASESLRSDDSPTPPASGAYAKPSSFSPPSISHHLLVLVPVLCAFYLVTQILGVGLWD